MDASTMETFAGRFKNSLVLATLLLLQIVALGVQVHRPATEKTAAGVTAAIPQAGDDGGEVSALRSWVVAAVSPVERLVHGAGRMVREIWWNYLDLRHARSENAALRQEMSQMRVEQAQIAEDALQGHRLQSLLAFQEHYVTQTVAAQVIGTSGTDRSRVVYLDKGAADGLRPDMAVITPDGIVGKIRAVYPDRAPHVAQVLLLSDQTSGAGVILEKTRIRAVLRGTTDGRLEVGNLTPDDQIKAGDVVTTSGGDGIFPRGLPVGTVEGAGPDSQHPPYWAVRIRPAANLQRLEEVLVVTGTATALPTGTQQALVRGAKETATARAAAQQAAEERARAEEAAREEAARSAAEIVAQRLPSLHDPNETDAERQERQKAAATAAASPKTAGGSVPPPLPPEHTDRYSPGTAPPASALVPGARSSTGETDIPVQPARPRTRPKTQPSGEPAGAADGQPAQRQGETPPQ